MKPSHNTIKDQSVAEEQTHFEIIECESHMPVAIRQFDSEEEAMEYLNMRLKSEQPTHPSERHEAQESEGTTAQGLHEFSEQLRIQSILRMLEMNARGESTPSNASNCMPRSTIKEQEKLLESPSNPLLANRTAKGLTRNDIREKARSGNRRLPSYAA